jgi:hypothetical protein
MCREIKVVSKKAINSYQRMELRQAGLTTTNGYAVYGLAEDFDALGNKGSTFLRDIWHQYKDGLYFEVEA